MNTQKWIIFLLSYHHFNLKLRLEAFAAKTVHEMSSRECFIYGIE